MDRRRRHEVGRPDCSPSPWMGARLVASCPVWPPNPAWSPSGDFIMYSGPFSGGTATARKPGAPLQGRAARWHEVRVSHSWSGRPAHGKTCASAPAVIASWTRPISSTGRFPNRGTSGCSISSRASDDNHKSRQQGKPARVRHHAGRQAHRLRPRAAELRHRPDRPAEDVAL